jgi:CheY-like chemotaxis protein
MGPRTDRTAADGALDHLAAAIATLDDADPDPTLDELADEIETHHHLRERRKDPHRPYVLLIDPDQTTRPVLVGMLSDGGCEVVAALRTGMTAEYAIRQHRPTVIVADLDLRPGGGRRGLLLVASIAKEAPEVPLLVVASPDLMEMADRVVRAGARRLLPKRDVDGLVAAVREAHAAQTQAAYPSGGADGGDAHRPG